MRDRAPDHGAAREAAALDRRPRARRVAAPLDRLHHRSPMPFLAARRSCSVGADTLRRAPHRDPLELAREQRVAVNHITGGDRILGARPALRAGFVRNWRRFFPELPRSCVRPRVLGDDMSTMRVTLRQRRRGNHRPAWQRDTLAHERRRAMSEHTGAPSIIGPCSRPRTAAARPGMGDPPSAWRAGAAPR
jgi:hypothetical protein